MNEKKRKLLEWAWSCSLAFRDVSYYAARESLVCTVAEYTSVCKQQDAAMEKHFEEMNGLSMCCGKKHCTCSTDSRDD
jgi:hypothetical protein